jgi:hypothetical protein
VRIPYPERISIKGAGYFALALFVVQFLEGTALYFCLGTAAFFLIATAAFNAAGGLTRAAGAYVFFYSALVVIVGICYKAFLGEPAQTNLLAPKTDIAVYVGSITAMYVAVVASRRFSRKTALLENILKEEDMYRASIGCIVFGAIAGFGIALLGQSGRAIQSAFGQLNVLIPIGIILGVTYEIRRSGGTRCTNTVVLIGTAYFFCLGTIGFSKQGMIQPLFCWLLPIWALRYRLSYLQIGGIFLATFVVFYYLTPFAQYGRGQVEEDATFSTRMAVAYNLLSHPETTRQLYLKGEEEASYQGARDLSSYFNTPQGLWERLQMITPDDALNNYTNQGHTFGLLPIFYGFVDVVPHFIWPNKPGANLGNMYAHEINGVAQGEGDVTTGISFSPSGEAYHLEGWAGIFILAPLMWFMLFFVFDSLLGDLRRTPWGMLIVALLAHSAPEGGLSYIPYLCSFVVEAIIFCAFFAKWFAPLIASLIIGPAKRQESLRLSPVTLPQRNMPERM